MTDDVISGTYSDFKIVKTRSVAQIIIEIPLEAGQSAIDLLGLPNPSSEVFVAVARLQSQPRIDLKASEPKGRSYAQEAGILSNDPAFHLFIQAPDLGPDSEFVTIAAEYIREKCDVASRRDLTEGTPEGAAFRDLKAEFNAWKEVG